MGDVAAIRERITQLWEQITRRWRTSLQVRVVGSFFLLSVLVVGFFAFGMVVAVADNLVSNKETVAKTEIERSTVRVQEQIATSDPSATIQSRLGRARDQVISRAGTAQPGEEDTPVIYDAIILATSPAGQDISAPDNATEKVPASLRQQVHDGNIAYQLSTFARAGEGTYKAVIIGSPVASEISGVELYLIFPLDAEEETINFMRGLAIFGGIALMLFLVGLLFIFTKQVTQPVRSASRIAERFAQGHLRERMVVEGEDEMARLALSFNAMAESLSRQIQSLREYGNLQRQFTSDVSHELRTPLTTVRMAADLIYDDADSLDPYARRAVELMVTELDRFELLLADLLEISRHDAGVAELSAERIDVRSIITSAWEQVKHIADEVGVEVSFDVPEEPVFATVDARRIERILRNLIANAIDHSEQKPITVVLTGGKEQVVIQVIDHGVGLKPGQENLVFNRFWRADPSRKRHSGGTGLGLAISQEDALLHGGVITAHGEVGEGATFTLTVPTVPFPPKPALAQGPQAFVLDLVGDADYEEDVAVGDAETMGEKE